MDPITMSLITSMLPMLLGKGGAGGANVTAGGLSPDTALNPLYGLLQAPSLLFQGGLGLKQLLDARKLEKSTVRPMYAVPGAQNEALATSRAMAYANAPGLGLARAGIDRSLAGGLGSATQAGGPEGLGAAVAMANDASNRDMELAAMQESYRTGQMANMLGQLNRQAEYQDKAWTKNREEPFLAASEKAAQLRDAGYTNVNDFLLGAGGTASSIAKNGMLGRGGKYGQDSQSPTLPPIESIQFDPQKGADQGYDFTGIASPEARAMDDKLMREKIAYKYSAIDRTNVPAKGLGFDPAETSMLGRRDPGILSRKLTPEEEQLLKDEKLAKTLQGKFGRGRY